MQETFSFKKKVPEKLYYKIREVAKILSVESYVLRFWETEFKSVRPVKSKTGQRMYRKKDIENLELIRKLLYEEKYTIAGARSRLKELAADKKTSRPKVKASVKQVLQTVREGIVELLEEAK
jgi:DNA-binding transcriptional MerR regulator